MGDTFAVTCILEIFGGFVLDVHTKSNISSENFYTASVKLTVHREIIRTVIHKKIRLVEVVVTVSQKRMRI